jgi:excisionase family DNA binding protein
MVEDEGWPRGRAARVDRGPRTLTASEAAALLGVSVATVRGWADQGRLPSHRTVGGHRRFELEELRAWLAERGAPAMRRMAIRLLRVLASGLETGRPAASTGRAAVAGFRGGLEGSAGARVVVEHTRVAIAVVQEAEAAVADGVVIEPLGLPALHAVIDHALAAVTRGFEQAQPLRRTRAPGGAPRG